MNMLWYGLKVALLGMIVVFIGLVILIGCIKLLSRLTGKSKTPDTPKAPPPQLPAQPVAQPPAQMRSYAPGPLLTRKNPAFYAVITAAIAQVMASEGRNPEGGFAIRDVKTISERTAGPPITPRDDAFFAVVAGAVSQILESEGKNPEGGFAIRSIRAL